MSRRQENNSKQLPVSSRETAGLIENSGLKTPIKTQLQPQNGKIKT